MVRARVIPSSWPFALRLWSRVALRGVPRCPPWFMLPILNHGGHRGHRGFLSSAKPRANSQRLFSGGLHCLLGAFVHLLRRHIFLVRRDAPVMSEGVPQKTRTVSIELVFDRSLDFRSLRDRFFENFVAIWNIHIQTHRRRTDGLCARMAHLQVFVRQHDARVADLQLGMADLAVGTIRAYAYGRAENVLVEFDRFRGTLDDEVRRNVVVSLGNVVGFAHNFSPRG